MFVSPTPTIHKLRTIIQEFDEGHVSETYIRAGRQRRVDAQVESGPCRGRASAKPQPKQPTAEVVIASAVYFSTAADINDEDAL